MSNQGFRLIDCENDRREANGANHWDTLEECFEDIKDGITENGESADYLPWRIVTYDKKKTYRQMFTRAKIKSVKMHVELRGMGISTQSAQAA